MLGLFICCILHGTYNKHLIFSLFTVLAEFDNAVEVSESVCMFLVHHYNSKTTVATVASAQYAEGQRSAIKPGAP